MSEISREEAINLLDNLKGFIEDSQNNDYDGAIKIAMSDMRKMEKIDQIVDEMWDEDSYFNNAVRFAEKIEQIVKEV